MIDTELLVSAEDKFLSLPESKQKELLENILQQMKEIDFFRKFRSSIQTGTLSEDDAYDQNAPTSINLDLYYETISDEQSNEAQKLKRDLGDIYHEYVNCLKPNSFERKVLMAFYESEEDHPFSIFTDNVSSKQTFNDKNFPDISELDSILKLLAPKQAE